MSDLARKKETTEKVVRSLLMSAPSGLSPSDLEKDYLTSEHEALPYRLFGCTDVLGFVKTLPDIVHISYNNRNIRLFGIADKSTKHLQPLLDNQKKPKRYSSLVKANIAPKRRPSSKCLASVHPPAYIQKNIAKVLQRNGKGISLTKFPNIYKEVNGITLTTETYGFKTLTELFISIPSVAKLEYGRRNLAGCNLYVFPVKNETAEKEEIANKIKAVNSSIRANRFNTDVQALKREKIQDVEKNSNVRAEDANPNNAERMDSEVQPGHQPSEIFNNPVNTSTKILKRQILQILADEPKGVWAIKVPAKFKKKFGKEMRIKEFGYFSLIEFIATLSDDVSINRPNPMGDWLLRLRNAGENDKKSAEVACGVDEGLEVTKMEVKELLINSKLGIELCKLSDTYKKVYKHDIHLEEYTLNNMMELVTQIKGVCIYNSEGKLYASLTEKEKEIFLQAKAKTKQREFPADAVGDKGFYIPPALPSNEVEYIDVFVSHVITPGDFCVQIYGKQTTGALNNLMDDLERFYCSEEGDRYKIPHHMVTVGQICAAIFLEDMNWHRGVIVRVNVSCVDVLYVDYGTVASVAIASLRLLKSSFLRLPSQMIKARLAHVQPKNLKGWTLSSRDFMLDMCRDRPIVALVTAIKDRQLSLCLCDTSEPDLDIHINDRLVNHDHAVFFPDDMPRSQASELRDLLLEKLSTENRENTYGNFLLEENTRKENHSQERNDSSFEIETKPKITADSVDFCESQRGPGLGQTRFVRQYKLCNKYDIHLINYNGQALITSADISYLLHKATDVLLPMLTLKNLTFPEVVLYNEKKNERLFVDFLKNDVRGTVENGKSKKIVFMYCIEDLPAMICGLGHEEQSEIILEVKQIIREFDTDEDYWVSPVLPEKPEKKLGLVDRDLRQTLMSRRKALLEDLSSTVNPHTLEEIEKIERELIACSRDGEAGVAAPSEIEVFLNLMKNQYGSITASENRETIPKKPKSSAESNIKVEIAASNKGSTGFTDCTGDKLPSKPCQGVRTATKEACTDTSEVKTTDTPVAEVTPFNHRSKEKLQNELVEIPGSQISHNVIDFASVRSNLHLPQSRANILHPEAKAFLPRHRTLAEMQIQDSAGTSNVQDMVGNLNLSIPQSMDYSQRPVGLAGFSPRDACGPIHPQRQWQTLNIPQETLQNPVNITNPSPYRVPQMPPLYYKSIPVPGVQIQTGYSFTHQNTGVNIPSSNQLCQYHPVTGLPLVSPMCSDQRRLMHL